MDFARFQKCLAEDYARFTEALAAADPAGEVPGCPGWTAAELGFHLAATYRHKIECIRRGVFPEPWPPQPATDDPVREVAAAYDGLLAEFAGHKPDDHAATWHGPDQTVGFWIRRMAHETAIHRIDAERAAGFEIAPTAEDLAVDGIAENTELMLGYGSRAWIKYDEVARLFTAPDPRPVLVGADGGRAWRLTASEKGIAVERCDGALGHGPDAGPGSDADADADPGSGASAGESAAALIVDGPAQDVYRWLWNRPSGPGLRISGDPLALAQFDAFKVGLTQ